MNYVGKWKFHSVMTYNEENMPVYLSSEEYLNSPMPYIDESNEEEVADEIRERIKRELCVTASVGVSFCKVFAKLGSDYKKPDATTVISRENFKDIV